MQQVHEELTAVGAPHALIGGFALSVHGYARATNDIDFLVHHDFRDRVISEMLARGFSRTFTSDDVDQWDGEAPVDFLYARRDISLGMLQRAQASQSLYGIRVLDASDLIGLKIRAYSNNPKRLLQDLADIQKLIEKNDIDWDRVRIYADTFGEWDRVKNLK